MEAFVGKGRVLDVGCGAGLFLASMAARGWTTVGVEPNRAYAHALRSEHHLNVISGGIEALGPRSEPFDAVTMFDVIEHVPDPLDTLAHVRRLVRPGGVLVLTTPNVLSLERRLFGQHWQALQPPDHLTLFSSSGLQAMLRRAGFDRIQVGRSPVCYIWPSLRMSLKLRPRPGLLDAILKAGFAVPANLMYRLGAAPAQVELYATCDFDSVTSCVSARASEQTGAYLRR
jgi:SAM-dependent methyltransferase